MSKLLPIIGGLTAGTAVIGGTATYYLTKENPKPFKEQFSHSLISSDEAGNAIFKERLSKLKDNEVKSDNAKLKLAKSKADGKNDNGLAELKAACKEIYDSNFTNRESDIFKDFVAYCSKSIKDVIAKDKLNVGDIEWKAKQNEKLKNSKSTLVAELETIKNKPTIGDDDLKNWCKGIENELFEGSENITFKNANEFCTKDS